MKNALLAPAIVALIAGAATAGTVHPAIDVHGVAAIARPSSSPQTVLWNQNSGGSGAAFNSQNFTSNSFGSPYDSEGADDFVLPRDATMTGVDVTGIFTNNSGLPANGGYAWLYSDRHAAPYKVLAVGFSHDGGPNFTFKIKHRLKAGKRYWISAIVNCDEVAGCGEWGWEVRLRNGKPAVWENPGDGWGTGCSTWKPLGHCTSLTSYQNADFMFDVTGTWR